MTLNYEKYKYFRYVQCFMKIFLNYGQFIILYYHRLYQIVDERLEEG